MTISGAQFRLILIIAIAVVLRVVVAFMMGNHIEALPGIHDQLSYDALAQSLLRGHGYEFVAPWYPFTPANTPTAHWSFIYPAYLAAVYSMSGYSPLVARVFQAIFTGVLTCWLVYRLSQRIFGCRVAVLAAFLAAIYTYFVYYSATLMTESFFMVTALAVLDLSYMYAEKPTIGRAVGLGILLGVGTLLRQTLMPFAIVLLLWVWGRRGWTLKFWQFTVPLVVLVLLILPWTLRNYFVYSRILILNSNAGYAFYSSNHPNTGIDWSPQNSVNPIPPDLEDLNEAEKDSALMRIGFQYVLADPIRYALLTISKVKEYYKFWPSPDSSWVSNLQRLVSFAILLPLSLVGLYLGRRLWRQWLLLILFTLLIATVHLLSWPTARYRVPTDACLMPFAALALVQGYDYLRLLFTRCEPQRSSEETLLS